MYVYNISDSTKSALWFFSKFENNLRSSCYKKKSDNVCYSHYWILVFRYNIKIIFNLYKNYQNFRYSLVNSYNYQTLNLSHAPFSDISNKMHRTKLKDTINDWIVRLKRGIIKNNPDASFSRQEIKKWRECFKKSYIDNENNRIRCAVGELIDWLFVNTFWKDKIKEAQDVVNNYDLIYKITRQVRRPSKLTIDDQNTKLAKAIFRRYREYWDSGRYINFSVNYLEFVNGERYEIISITDIDFEEKAIALFNEWKGGV